MRANTPLVVLTAANVALTLGVWMQPGWATPEAAPAVLRAQLIELVDAQGEVRAQLHLGDDGSGNLRLRDGTGKVRFKLGTSNHGGTGLLMMDESVEPVVDIDADASGGSITLTGKDRKQRVITP